ncbi:MAG: D-alanyl-D-alanine carboxypeptidase [Oscillospiraceae bacterium]|nr:D-alanyl-D-alanine carboxypeptidase [Oscillospiraceae bacterium]
MKKYRIPSFFFALVLAFTLTAPALALETPEPHCGAAIVVDGDYGEVLFDLNAHEKMYPASTTKIMTSLVVLDAVEEGQLSLDTPITASAQAVVLPAGSSTAGIKAGEVLTVEQLLYCDLVPSANEACNILAEAVAGSSDAFVELMNAKARELGAVNTHFTNPHGLHDPDHYTTAYDLYLMAKAAMEYEVFRTIVSTPKYVLPATNLSASRTLYSTNIFLSNWYVIGYTYSRAIGIKTGYTEEAGRCLVSAAVDDQGRTFYCVMLGSEFAYNEAGEYIRYSFADSRKLLDWAFDNFKRITLLDENTENIIREVPVSLSETDYVLALPVGSISATMPIDYDPARAEYRIQLPESLEAPVSAGDKLGTVSIIYEGVNYGTLDMVASDDVERSDFLYYKQVALQYWAKWWVKALVILVAVLILVLILALLLRPRRRNSRRYSYSGGGRSSGGYRGRRR